MKEHYKKQRTIIISICIILIGIIIYYVVTKEKTSDLDVNELMQYEEESNTQQNETQEETGQVTIYITGAVNKPGVYTLKEGSRIADAVEQAQGLKEEANSEEINLAYILEDGMQITIPSKTESQDNKESKENKESETKQQTYTQATSQKININTATQEELETLTGIGPSTATKIIQHRKENGKFKTIEDIKNVKGIGESKYDKIKDKICVR